MSELLEISLVCLVVVIAVSVVFLTVYLCKTLIKLSQLIMSLDKVSNTVNDELQPIMDEVGSTLKVISSFAQNADNNFLKSKKIILSLLGILSVFLGGIKNVTNLSGGFLKGIIAGFKMFSKK